MAKSTKGVRPTHEPPERVMERFTRKRPFKRGDLLIADNDDTIHYRVVKSTKVVCANCGGTGVKDWVVRLYNARYNNKFNSALSSIVGGAYVVMRKK